LCTDAALEAPGACSSKVILQNRRVLPELQGDFDSTCRPQRRYAELQLAKCWIRTVQDRASGLHDCGSHVADIVGKWQIERAARWSINPLCRQKQLVNLFQRGCHLLPELNRS